MLRSLFKLVSAAAIGQFVGLVLSPVITTLYGPEILGKYGQNLSYAAIMATIIGGRFDLALIEVRDQIRKINLIQLSLVISTIFLALSVLISSGMNLPFGLFPVAIIAFLLNLVTLYNSFLNSNSMFGAMAKNKFVQAVLPNVLFLLGGLLSDLLEYQFLMLAYAVTLGSIGIGIFTKLKIRLKFNSYRLYSALIRKYYRFPLFLLPSTLLSELSGNLPIMLATMFFGLREAGVLYLANKLIAIPSVFITNAIGEVYRGEAAKIYSSKGNCKDLYMNYLYKLLGLAMVSSLFMLFVIDYLIDQFYGIKWVDTAKILKIFTIMMFGQIFSSPLSYTIVFKNYHKHDFYLQLLRLLLAATSIGLIWNAGNFFLGLLVYSIVYLFYYISHSYLQYRASLG